MKKQKTQDWVRQLYNHGESHLLNEVSILTHYNFQGNERIIDVGCGDGKISLEISKFVPKGSVIGIDRSKPAIKIAKKNYPKDKYPNLEFIHTKTIYIRYQQEFDVAISLNYLNWIGKQELALQKINDALKSNGILLGMFYIGSQEFWDSLEIIKGCTRWNSFFVDFINPLHRFTPSEYRRLLLEANFQPSYYNVAKMTMSFKTKEDFESNLSEWLPHLHQIPKELRKTFLSNFIDIFTKLAPNDSSGQIKWTYERLEFKAHKKAEV